MAKERTKIEDYAFLSDTQTGALVSRDGCVDGFVFRGLTHRRALLRFWAIRETDTGDFSQRKMFKRRVVSIETRRSFWKRKLKLRAAPCA
jgi:hypothetical protein